MVSNRSQFSVLLVLVLLSWSTTILLAPLVGKIAVAFGLSTETEVGNISALFLLVGGVLAFLWVGLDDYLSKRVHSSRKLLLVTASLIWIMGLYLTSVSQDYIQLLIYQMITALGYAAITPLVYSMAMDLTPAEGRAKAFGYLDVSAMIGVGVGLLLSGSLVDLDFIPWSIPFVVIATFGLTLLGFIIGLQDPKRGLQDRELSDALSRGATYNFHVTRSNIIQMLKKRSNILILLFNLSLFTASGSISYYFIRMMVNDHQFSSALAVLFFIATYGIQIVGAIFWTRRADRKFSENPNGKVRVLLESLLTGPPFLIIAYTLTFTIAEIWLVGLFAILLIIGAFLISGLIAISFAFLGEINPPEIRPTIFSLNSLSQTLGRAIGIFLMGILFSFFQGVYHWGFALITGIYLGATLLILPLFRLIPRDLSLLDALLQERSQQLQANPSEKLADQTV